MKKATLTAAALLLSTQIHSGAVTAAEVTEATAGTNDFVSLDSNKDNSIDAKEAALNETINNQFADIDQDGDKKISSEEFKLHLKKVSKDVQAAS